MKEGSIAGGQEAMSGKVCIIFIQSLKLVNPFLEYLINSQINYSVLNSESQK